jgi:hypothetical protein
MNGLRQALRNTQNTMITTTYTMQCIGCIPGMTTMRDAAQCSHRVLWIASHPALHIATHDTA